MQKTSKPGIRTLQRIYATSCFTFLIASIGVRSLVGWPGFLACGALLVASGILMSIREEDFKSRLRNIPVSLVIFLLLATVSISWSAYPLESFLGVGAQIATTAVAFSIAVLLSWQEILSSLSHALRIIITLSLLFELYVSLFIKAPLLQGFVSVNNPDNPSKLLYWSRNLLFSGGPIQGVVANSALLGFIALLGTIIFWVQLRARTVSKISSIAWLLIAFSVLALTRSATVFVCLLAVAVITVFITWARAAAGSRKPLYAVMLAALFAAIAAAIWARPQLLTLLGKSSDFTGRFEIWHKVNELADQKPLAGWGWVSHWAPWVEPFASLDTKVGLPVMHAHNAWLDVRLQLGVLGLIVFSLLVFSTLQQAWCLAVDRPRSGATTLLPYSAHSVYPVLILTALVVQSLTESRILVESGWLLLTLFATKQSLGNDDLQLKN